MKYIITESRLERIAIKWLNDNYGDLEPYEMDKVPDYSFFYKGDRFIFGYNKNNKDVVVSYDEIWSVFKTYFNINNSKIEDLLIVWLEERYNLKVRTADFI